MEMAFLLIVLIPLFVAVIRLVLRGLIRFLSPAAKEDRCIYYDVMEEHHKASIHGLTEEQLAKHRRDVLSKGNALLLGALVAIPMLLVMETCAHAQGTQIVFDPTMYARQLHQLEQEIQMVTTLGEQLKLMVKDTKGGLAGNWSSNENLLSNLGGIISEQEGLSYTVSGLAQQFQQLYPGYSTTGGVQSPAMSMDTTLNTLNGALQSAQSQAQDFQADQALLQTLETKNGSAIGNLQVAETANEIALAQIQQIQMLRQLAMATMNSQNTAAAAQLNAQTASQQTALAIIGAPAQISPW